jgi:hypothetical protein
MSAAVFFGLLTSERRDVSYKQPLLSFEERHEMFRRCTGIPKNVCRATPFQDTFYDQKQVMAYIALNGDYSPDLGDDHIVPEEKAKELLALYGWIDE